MNNKIHMINKSIEVCERLVSEVASLLCCQRKQKQVAFLVSTPTHGNLGDHAIVYAQKAFLFDLGYTGGITEMTKRDYFRLRSVLGRIVRETTLVVIDGGGNVGTLWPEESDKMNDVVTRFSKNPIAIFPQTAFFEDSPFGEECRRGVADVYAKNANLLFFSRDRATYEVMGEMVPSLRNLYVPDIVLYLDESRDGTVRDGALLCLRADRERVTGEGGSKAISSALEVRGLSVREISTVVDEPSYIDAKNRDAVLEAKWEEFRSAEIVVTDRLHGMIFSAITGTPCVALDNVSRKVSQGYEWIRHIRNIRIAATVDEVPMLVDDVLAVGPCRYDRTPLDPYYDEMKAAIRSVVE